MRHYPDPGDRQPVFHIYNHYNLPTKYIALVTSCGQASITGDSGSQSSAANVRYVVTVIPEVFTSHSSGILKGYTAYIFLFLVLVIFIRFQRYCPIL